VKVKISYLNSQGRDNIAEVVDMFSKDRGPLTFELLENNYFFGSLSISSRFNKNIH